MDTFGNSDTLPGDGARDGAEHLVLVAIGQRTEPGQGYWTEPVVSDEVVEGYDEKLRPVLTPFLPSDALDISEASRWPWRRSV